MDRARCGADDEDEDDDDEDDEDEEKEDDDKEVKQKRLPKSLRLPAECGPHCWLFIHCWIHRRAPRGYDRLSLRTDFE